MKNYKNFIAGLITGLLIVTAGVSATVPGGTLGGLFELVTISQNGYSTSNKYVLDGENIKDGSITKYELANNSVGSGEILSNAVGTDEILDGSIVTSDINLSNFELNASKITTGTFKSGNYTFPALLEVNSDLKVLGDIFEGGNNLSAKYLGIGAIAVNSSLLEGKNKAYYTNASNLNNGILNNTRLNSNVSLLGQKINTNEQDISFIARNSDKLEGKNKAYYTNASNLNNGILNNARLNSNITKLDQIIEENELSIGVKNKLNNNSGKVNLGTNKWTIISNGNNLVFKFNGVTKIIFNENGKITAKEYIIN